VSSIIRIDYGTIVATWIFCILACQEALVDFMTTDCPESNIKSVTKDKILLDSDQKYAIYTRGFPLLADLDS
jgi:hypothetical protein